MAERTRRCEIIFPEGDTTTCGFACVGPCLAEVFGLAVDFVGDGGLASVGVGGVTRVVGASPRLGGVEGILVTIRLGTLDLRLAVDCVSSPSCICVGELCNAAVSSRTRGPRFFPPKSAPNATPLVPELGLSGFPLGLGEADRRWGENASLSFPTGDAVLLMSNASSMVSGWGPEAEASWSDMAGFDSVVSESDVESSVSDAIRGEDRVK